MYVSWIQACLKSHVEKDAPMLYTALEEQNLSRNDTYANFLPKKSQIRIPNGTGFSHYVASFAADLMIAGSRKSGTLRLHRAQ